ncbi:MAG: CBS domain-containing protein [Proteobacteria bacterium]|nr:CBS domain-containing protein [Pseudomonadota bacterium]
MLARDVMTRMVATVTPTTPVDEIAGLLLGRSISAVPVVDAEERIVGIVSEGDLLRRPETGTERRRSWWLELISDPRSLATDYVKSHGRRAQDVMTRHVVSVTETTSVAAVADLLEARRIKRVPVVRDGKLVGIVSRADLIRVLARGTTKVAGFAALDDRSIRAAIIGQLNREPWANPFFINVVVENGTVELGGAVGSDEQRMALRVLAEGVPGVRQVVDHVSVQRLAAYS